MRNSVCECGNCSVSPCSIKVSTWHGERRVQFCSELHAAIWLIDQASHQYERDDDKTAAITKAQELFKPLKLRAS